MWIFAGISAASEKQISSVTVMQDDDYFSWYIQRHEIWREVSVLERYFRVGRKCRCGVTWFGDVPGWDFLSFPPSPPAGVSVAVCIRVDAPLRSLSTERKRETTGESHCVARHAFYGEVSYKRLLDDVRLPGGEKRPGVKLEGAKKCAQKENKTQINT